MSVESFTISPRGPFSLAEAASFGFGQREGQETGAGKTTLMRLAFCVDGYASSTAWIEPQFGAMAEPWRPFRTWAVVLIRAAANRILGRDLTAPAPAG